MKKLFTLLSVLFIGGSAFAQIPNAGFENWTTTGNYKTPDGWATLDSATNIASVYTCTQGTPGAPGNYFLDLTSKTIPFVGVAPGVAISGTIDATTFQPKSGFAFTGRPEFLVGNWQYMGIGGDQGFVAVLLSKWNTTTNSRDTVSYTMQNLTGMEMSWVPFSITLNYQHGENPDTAIIALSSSQLTTAMANSYLYVDSLDFAGNVPNGVKNVNNVTAGLTLYPNPASDNFTVTCSNLQAANVRLQLFDITGRMIQNIDGGKAQGAYQHTINVGAVAKGIYLLKVSDDKATQVERIVIQ